MGFQRVDTVFQEATIRAGIIDTRLGSAGEATDSYGIALGSSLSGRTGAPGSGSGGPLHPVPIYRRGRFC